MLAHKRFSVEPIQIPSHTFHSQQDLELSADSTCRSGKDLSTTETNYSLLSRSKCTIDSEEDLEIEPMEAEACEDFHQEWSCSKGENCEYQHGREQGKRTLLRRSSILENFPELLLISSHRSASFLE